MAHKLGIGGPWVATSAEDVLEDDVYQEDEEENEETCQQPWVPMQHALPTGVLRYSH